MRYDAFDPFDFDDTRGGFVDRSFSIIRQHEDLARFQGYRRQSERPRSTGIQLIAQGTVLISAVTRFKETAALP